MPIKPELTRCNKLLDCGLSLITIGDNKIPNFSWKSRQTDPYSKELFELDYNYSGGKFRKDKTELPSTTGIGIVTGYNNLEVIDIDLKVLNSLKEQQDFWHELLGMCRDNIDDFDNKFVIYKTINNGYHILYRCQTIEGNLKIAKLKGLKEAIIETRGVGGYVFIYDNQISKRSYNDIQEVSILDRECLIDICKTYNYTGDQPIFEHKILPKEQEDKISVWQDYNDKTSIFDLLGLDFAIVQNLSDKYTIKRDGAKSPHSGYVYKNSNCMYLFSTGTIYPHEKLLSAFSVYTYKYHNGDFKESAKELYKKGFGSRMVKEAPTPIKQIKINQDDLTFPIDIFPVGIQNYILECKDTLGSSLDYMGCAMLWSVSMIIGNSIKIKIKNGWVDPCVLWISIVGKAGIGKTPSIQNIIHPLVEVNKREIKRYMKENEKYLHFLSLDKKEREKSEEIKQPKKSQFIVNDITLEALVNLHEDNKNGVGVFKDELAGWIKDMNKYRSSGSDLEQWLSSWSGASINMNRKTAKSSFVDKPFMPVIGGIQPNIFNSFYTEENKDNGFIDRFLLCFPEMEVNYYNSNEIPQETIDWYSNFMIAFFEEVKLKITRFDEYDDIKPFIATFSKEANVEWIRIFNHITDSQNSDEENEYMKSMLPKQKSYIPRFALIINCLHFFDLNEFSKANSITKESILKAERLSNYFIAMAKKVKIKSIEVSDVKNTIRQSGSTDKFKQFEAIYLANPEVSKTEVADILGVSRKTVYEFLKRIK